MTVYPGTEPPVFTEGASIPRAGFRELKITLFSHTGTHLDAPAHILPNAKTLDQFSIDRFSGTACVVDAEDSAGGVIDLDALDRRAEAVAAADFVLLRSGWSRHWNTSRYFQGYPILTERAARRLAASDLKGVGVDTISVDAADSTDFPIHRILLGSNVLIIENLANLESLPDSLFRFSCFPLRIADADGSPVRAIAEIEMSRSAKTW